MLLVGLFFLEAEAVLFFFFFFQAEDGIRDHCVTGVQTCALPILPVREIRGVSTTHTRWWSRRRAAIEARQAEITAEFQQRFGRPPTAIEAKSLADQATLETRDAKHGHRSERDQRAAWRAEADNVIGDPAEVDEMYAHA